MLIRQLYSPAGRHRSYQCWPCQLQKLASRPDSAELQRDSFIPGIVGRQGESPAAAPVSAVEPSVPLPAVNNKIYHRTAPLKRRLRPSTDRHSEPNRPRSTKTKKPRDGLLASVKATTTSEPSRSKSSSPAESQQVSPLSESKPASSKSKPPKRAKRSTPTNTTDTITPLQESRSRSERSGDDGSLGIGVVASQLHGKQPTLQTDTVLGKAEDQSLVGDVQNPRHAPIEAPTRRALPLITRVQSRRKPAVATQTSSSRPISRMVQTTRPPGLKVPTVKIVRLPTRLARSPSARAAKATLRLPTTLGRSPLARDPEAASQRPTMLGRSPSARDVEVASQRPTTPDQSPSARDAGATSRRPARQGRKKSAASAIAAAAAPGNETSGLADRLLGAHVPNKVDVSVETLKAKELDIQSIDADRTRPVPALAHGLDRVLFNPGVYHLQDPRSRVFNFDPHVQMIRPIADFNFNSLQKYVTSSEDKVLQVSTKEHGKKYFGSSSSMGSALSHFHFLLSQWRPLCCDGLSQAFKATNTKVTRLHRLPAAIFLRWRDGCYGIDADKEHDMSNVLSMLGHSMEKFLTLSKGEFERYSKSSKNPVTTEEAGAAQAFHYSTLGDMVMRSQLDAHDPRLPGTGMFDLKTRAVASIRMDVQRYEHGLGYEIRSRLGEWQSFEREYYDMMRAAFLKYSLQVRMGRMDGVLVAYHNIQRIFGFHYISLPEMDSVLHGSWDTTLGDQEFKLSLKLLNQIFDLATAQFPRRSLRIHLETRESQTPFLYIFAQPMPEEAVVQIQTTNQAKSEQLERELLGLAPSGRDASLPSDEDRSDDDDWERIQARVEEELEADRVLAESPSTGPPMVSSSDLEVADDDRPPTQDDREPVDGDASRGEAITASSAIHPGKTESMLLGGNEVGPSNTPEREGQIDPTHERDEADQASDEIDRIPPQTDVASASESDVQDTDTPGDRSFLDRLGEAQQTENEQLAGREILAMTLTIRNKVNGRFVSRPQNLTTSDDWSIEYSLSKIASPTRAWALYEACRQRRRELRGDVETEDDEVSHYVRRLREMSEAGRVWRGTQDALDAARDPVVLEPPPSTDRSR